jgi:hypothetical protein
MTVSRRTLAAAALLASSTAVLARNPALAEGPDVAAVEAAVSSLTKAMLAADRGKLQALTASQLSYGHSSGRIETQKEYVDVVADKKTVNKSIVLSKQTVAIAGNNAIVRHARESESSTGDGKWNGSKIGVLQVSQKQGSDWNLLARQAFRTA